MPAIDTPALPETSLLARHRGPECYRDAFRTKVPRAVSLPEFITAFYASYAFTPERYVLRAIGPGTAWWADSTHIAALAEGRAERLAAWTVEAREERQILLKDHRDHTCSWLMVEPADDGTTNLWFGSGVRNADGIIMRALMPLHRWYSRVLLAGAVRGLR